MKKFITLLAVIAMFTVTSCGSFNMATCATYSSAKPYSIKAGTYNPRKPAGLQIGKTVVGRIN